MRRRIGPGVHHLAGRGLNVSQQGRQFGALGIDLVDDDQAVQLLLSRVFHHAPRHRLSARCGAEDDGRCLHHHRCGQALGDEVGRAECAPLIFRVNIPDSIG